MIEPPCGPAEHEPLVVHQEWAIGGGITLRLVQRFREPEFSELIHRFFYEGFPGVDWEQLLSEDERGKHRALKKSFGFPGTIRLGAYEGERLVGWTLGWQESESTFYMANSGVLQEYRRRGIYTQLVTRLIALLREQGYQVISSRHVATNNAVIVPKLKLGFVITGMELYDAFGTMVRLAYYTHPKRRKLVDVRAGLSRPDEELAAVMRGTFQN